MPRINRIALSMVDDVAVAQRGLVTSAQLVEIGFAHSTIRHRARQGGPWRRVLPSVYLVDEDRTLSEAQRILASHLYVGTPCLVTGGAALRRAGIASARDIGVGEVHLLVPHDRRRASTHFVHVQRSRYWPAEDDGLYPPGAPLVRVVLDACRTLSYRNEVSALLTEVVRDGHATVPELEDGLRHLQRRRSALIRDVLTSMRAGVVSGPEDELFRRWRESDLPDAVWNADLYLGGEFLARPDVYLPEYGLIIEVDSEAHHSTPADFDRTMRRHARITARGLVALHVAPRRLREDWSGFFDDVVQALRVQEGRKLPDVGIVLWTERRERGA
jgi:hypothetical protein